MTLQESPEERAASRMAQAQLLALCARLLAEEIDAPLYRALAAEPMKSALSPLGGSFIEAALEALGEERALEALAVEYCRLFVGPHPACPPYHSAFRGEALLGARHEARVHELAARHELELVLPARIVSADHLAMELSLLAAALARPLDPSAPDLATAELTEQLLLPWAPDFAAALTAAAELGPYRALASLLQALLHGLSQALLEGAPQTPAILPPQ